MKSKVEDGVDAPKTEGKGGISNDAEVATDLNVPEK